MATRTDVAKLAGVSVATVSNVFIGRKLVSAELTEKVKKAAEKLSYSPNYIARCLSLGRSHIIGIVITDYVNPFHMEIIRGIEHYAKRRGYIVTTFLHENCENGSEVVNYETLQVDAILNFTTNVVSESFINSLISEHTVFVDFGRNRGMSFVQDHSEAMEAAVKRLCELGHKKVGFISLIDKKRFEQDQRGILYRKLVEKYGLCNDENLIVYNEDITLKSEIAGYLCGKEFIERNTGGTAVLVMNDLAAFGFYRLLYEKRLKVPEDISVIGFDGVSMLQYATPRLSTISLDKFSFGTMMAEKVINCIESGEKGIGLEYGAKSIFLERESIGKIKNGCF